MAVKSNHIFKPMMLIIIVMLISFQFSCSNNDIVRYDTLNTKWTSQKFDLYFFTIKKPMSYFTIGEIITENETIPIFIDSRPFIVKISEITKATTSDGSYGEKRLFGGVYSYKDNKFCIKTNINEYSDERFLYLKGKTITFTREDLTEEEALKMRNEIIEKYGLNLESDSAGS